MYFATFFLLGGEEAERVFSKTILAIWGFPKMVGFPNKPMGFPTKNDHFGV